EHPGHEVLQGRVPMEGLDPGKDKVGANIREGIHQVLEIVSHPQQEYLVPPLPEGVSDLVLHLRLIVMPRRNFGRHLALVVGMAPSAVRGVEDHRDAQGGSGTGHASQSCPGSVWYRKGLESSGLGAGGPRRVTT